MLSVLPNKMLSRWCNRIHMGLSIWSKCMWMTFWVWSSQCHKTNSIMSQIQWCMGYTTFFHQTPSIARTLFPKRNLEGRRQIQHTKNATWVWIRWRGKNNVSWISQMWKTPDNIKRLDASRHAQNHGILFSEFESTNAKICHAFTCTPAGVGLLSLCNWVLKKCLAYVYLYQNPTVLTALKGCQALFRE